MPSSIEGLALTRSFNLGVFFRVPQGAPFGDITTLDHVSLNGGKNKFIALMGRSGSGKPGHDEAAGNPRDP